MSNKEPIQPVCIIIPKTAKSLRQLLQEHHVLQRVTTGNTIVLLEGQSLSDLDIIVPPGKRLAVISIDVLGGG